MPWSSPRVRRRWVELVAPVETGVRKPVAFFPSDWVRFAIRIPVKGKLRVFSFRRRDYLIPIYDRPDRRVLLMFGRQSEKSTTVGNKMLALAAMLKYYKILYVSPSQLQTRAFSQDRIAQPFALSQQLQKFVGGLDVDNVHEKVLRETQSIIRLRYSFLNPERIRGIPTDYLLLDELQDIFVDSIPVILETLTHSDHPTHKKWLSMSGTPKSFDNSMAFYWSKSTQSELAIPCEHHGTPNAPGSWHWNIIGEPNLGRHGLICDKCGNPLNRFHERRGWVDTVPNAKIRGYRLPQVIAPTYEDKDWEDEILIKYEGGAGAGLGYSRAKFFNEVLALPWEEGVRPITQGELMLCCDQNWTMTREQMLETIRWSGSRDIFAGIDYGSGEKSWTVVALGTYIQPNVFKIFYLHRFTGRETSPELQGKLLVELLERFHVRVSFGDYGLGYHQNDVLLRNFGPTRHNILQYVASAKKKIYYNFSKGRWIGERDDLMSAIVNAIKARKFQFPAWPSFQRFGQDILNVTIEFNEARQRTVFSHHPAKPDDSFHAILYCFMAACIITPRPDIIMSFEKTPEVSYE